MPEEDISLKISLETVFELVEQRQWSELRTYLDEFQPQEIAEFILRTDKKDRVLVFRALARKTSYDVFSYLEPDQQDSLLGELASFETRELLANLSPDDRTALLEEFPAPITRRFLKYLSPEDLKEARQLLGYPEESIGRLMTPDYIAVYPDMTVAEALDHIRANAMDSETVNIIYVRDQSGKLLDELKLRKLIMASPSATVRDLMDGTFTSLSVFDDREHAVNMMRDYDLVALPVVDTDGDLLGIVTFDDVMDVAEEEATEDIQKSASVSPLKMSYRAVTIGSLYLKRVGWLIWLVALSLASSGVIAAFEKQLAQKIILLFFMPLLLGTGGNAGAQSATLMIRALVLGEVKLSQWRQIFFKELGVGILLGLTLGTLAGLLGLLRGGFSYDVALTVGVSMFTIVIWANTVGMTFPFILEKFGLDPAVASGPLITTITDATGLFIYFTTASLIIKW